MLKETEIQTLVKTAQDGHEDAFGRIYEIYAPRVFSFLVVRLRHHELAEDLLHTVFLKAWTNINRYVPGNAKFSTWLFQIANYTLIDHWRTKKDTVEIDKIENLSDFAVNPKGFERYEYLWEAIQTLPDDQKSVLILRFKQDLNIPEIAEVLGKSRVSVRVIQHRGLKALKKKLEAKGYLEN
jgi:RNA polymerase sigma-70 factor (ECF subfamily)